MPPPGNSKDLSMSDDFNYELAGIDTGGNDQPNVWFDPERNAWVYRASAIGNCSMQLSLFRLGVEGDPPPEWMMKRFRDGHLHEGSVLAEIERQRSGWRIQTKDGDRQFEAEVWAREPSDDEPGVVLVGHIDGIALNRSFNPDSRVAEAKAFSKGNYENAMSKLKRGQQAFWDAYPYYRDSMTVYMTFFDVPAFFGIKNKDSGDVEVFDIPEPPGDIEALKAKALEIDAMVVRGNVPTKCDKKSFPCPMWRHHADDEDDGGDDEALVASIMGEESEGQVDLDGSIGAMAEFEQLCEEYDLAKEQEKDAKARKSEASRKIKERYLGEEGDDSEAKGIMFTVKWKRNTRRWLDRPAMEADGIDLSPYEREAESWYPNIVKKKKL